MNFKFALGFDIHKLVPNRKLKLCGIEIPYEKGLLGYSDGDVGLHALIDAALAAAGFPDMGILFPEGDPQYKNIDSTLLLKKTLKLLKKSGFKIIQVDLTFICDKPKLSDYYSKMKEQLSNLLKIEPSYIGIKARTTEGLIKHEETIACICLVILEKLVF